MFEDWCPYPLWKPIIEIGLFPYLVPHCLPNAKQEFRPYVPSVHVHERRKPLGNNHKTHWSWDIYIPHNNRLVQEQKERSLHPRIRQNWRVKNDKKKDNGEINFHLIIRISMATLSLYMYISFTRKQPQLVGSLNYPKVYRQQSFNIQAFIVVVENFHCMRTSNQEQALAKRPPTCIVYVVWTTGGWLLTRIQYSCVDANMNKWIYDLT